MANIGNLNSILGFLKQMGANNIDNSTIQDKLKGKNLKDFDRDGNGSVSTNEFALTLSEIFDLDDVDENSNDFKDAEDLLKGLNGTDSNSDGEISQSEFDELGLGQLDETDGTDGTDGTNGANSSSGNSGANKAGSSKAPSANNGGTTSPGVDKIDKDSLQNKTADEIASDRSSTLSDLSAAEAEKQNSTAKKAVDDAKEAYDKTVEELESEDEDVQAQIDDIRSRKEANDTAISDKNSQISNINGDISSKESEISDIDSQISSLKEPSESDYMHEVGEGEDKHQEVDQAAYNAAKAEYEQQKAALEEQKQAAEDELTNLQQELEAAEGELQSLEEQGAEIDQELSELLTNEKDNISGAEEAQAALQAYNEAQEAYENETKQIDENIQTLRDNLNTLDTALNEKRAEELRTSEDAWENTDFSNYQPETLAKIMEAYDNGKSEDEPSFLEKASEMLDSNDEEQQKKYDTIVDSLVTQAAKDEKVADKLQSQLNKELNSENPNTRLLDSIIKASENNKLGLANIAAKYDEVNGANSFESSLSNVYSDANSVANIMEAINTANEMKEEVSSLERNTQNTDTASEEESEASADSDVSEETQSYPEFEDKTYDEIVQIIQDKIDTSNLPETGTVGDAYVQRDENNNIVGISYDTFDDSGHYTGKITFDANGKLSSTTNFDKDGNKTYSQYRADGTLKSKEHTEFDEYGNLVDNYTYDYSEDGKTLEEFTQYNTSGDVVYSEEYSYLNGDENLPSEYKMYDSNHNLVYGIKATYDSNFNKIESCTYNSQGETTETRKYAYDDKGNQINKTTYNQDGNIVEIRDFKYDEKTNLLSQVNTVLYDDQGNEYFNAQYEYTGDWEYNPETKEYERTDSSVSTTFADNTNGKIEYSNQGDTGDCWLLSGINSLSYSKKGQELISNAITHNADGSYTVRFEGIDTDITITQEELDYARSEDTYSIGDDDMLIFELGYEAAINKIRNGEIEINGEHDNLSVLDSSDEAEGEKSIEGGFFEDVVYLLTGKDSTRVSEYDDNSDDKFDEILDKFEQNPESYSLCFSVGADDADDYSIIKDINGNYAYAIDGTGYHQFAIKSVDGDKVVIVNPWDSSKEYTISRDTIKQYANAIEYYEF